MSEIRIYVEGGGDPNSKARLREAFSKFLGSLRDTARQRRVKWDLILCGSRDEAFRAFQTGVRKYPNARVFLLVDAEQEVVGEPREHLAAREPWNLLAAADDQCHLMAQVMESWFLADVPALEAFYGSEFATGQIPRRQNVEEIPKDAVFTALNGATRRTQKQTYHKTQHAPKILERLAPDRVRARAPHCDRLFEELAKVLE